MDDSNTTSTEQQEQTNAEPTSGAQRNAGDGNSQQQEPSNAGAESKPKGTPNNAARDARVIAELKEKLAAAQSELQAAQNGANANANAAEALKALQADLDAKELTWDAEKALMQAGCVDTVALLAHVDAKDLKRGDDGQLQGLDVEKLKAAHPYLFGGATGAATVSTAASSQGSPQHEAVKTIKEGLAATLKAKE